MMKHFFSMMVLGIGLLCFSSCRSTVTENLPDTTQIALAKPVIPSNEEPTVETETAETSPPESTEEAPESLLPPTPANDPVVTEATPPPAPEKDPGQPKPEPCNEIHRQFIASMEESIQEQEAYIQTLTDDGEKAEAFLDLQDDKATLRKYKRDNGCD